MALLWSGLALSAIGDQAYVVAMSWIAIDTFGPYAGWLVALGPLSVILTVLFAGQVADRLAPLAAMIRMDALRALALAGVVVAWSVTGAPSPWVLGLAIVVLGSGQAVFRPALQIVVPSLVPDRAALPAANALLDATERIARLLAPGLSGVLTTVLPVRHLLTFDALSFGGSALALGLIGRRVRIAAVFAEPQAVLASMLHGARAASRVTLIRYELWTSALINGAWLSAYFLILPLLVSERGLVGPGGTGLAAYGLIISAYGFTNLVANLVVGSKPMPDQPGRQMFGGSMIVGAGIIGLATAAWLPDGWVLPGLMAAAALSAVGGPMNDIPNAVLRQTAFDLADVPAVTRAFLLTSQAGSLVGVAAAPILLGAFGPAPLLGLCGAMVLAASGACLWRNPKLDRTKRLRA